MDETTVTMSRKRIDFSQDEKAFMREQAAATNGDRLTYSAIARELNIRYKHQNEGRRTRQAVFDYMTAKDPEAPVREMVLFPYPVWRGVQELGENIREFTIAAVKEKLCQTSTKPAVPESAPSVAESSPSPQTPSTASGTGSSSSPSRKSGKQGSRR